MKDYNTRMAINIPEDETVKMVNMGGCTIVKGDSKEHLLTYGLATCVGVSIAIKDNNGKVSRLLAHVDMGQMIGISFDDLHLYFRRLKNEIENDIESIEISLSSTESFINLQYFNDRERKLLSMILLEFGGYGKDIVNIKFNYGRQVQISPDGVISNYSKGTLELHKEHVMTTAVSEFGGYVHPKLNIYITNFGAWMSNCLLGEECGEEEKEKELSDKYWQKYIQKGYNLVIAPSFNDPQYQAVYVTNWEEVIDPEWGKVIGCPRANHIVLEENLSESLPERRRKT